MHSQCSLTYMAKLKSNSAVHSQITNVHLAKQTLNPNRREMHQMTLRTTTTRTETMMIGTKTQK